MNLNTPRLDDGSRLKGAELNNVIPWPPRRTQVGCTGACNQGRLPCRAPDACGQPLAEPARKARIDWWGVATMVGFALSAGTVIFAIVTGWRLATGGF